MHSEEARRVLDRIEVVRHRCDLDVLAFFARHPRSLLTSETLASFLGYEVGRIRESLDTLIAAGLLDRRQTSAHAARLYLFAEGPPPDWLPPFRRLAASRDGRLALRQALARREQARGGDGGAMGERPVWPPRTARSAPRRGPRGIVAPRPRPGGDGEPETKVG